MSNASLMVMLIALCPTYVIREDAIQKHTVDQTNRVQTNLLNDGVDRYLGISPH